MSARSIGRLNEIEIRLVADTPAAVSVGRFDDVATDAVADFGVGQDVGLVLVRIIDELALDLTVETEQAIELAQPPSACLVGPDPAPDDAGLSDRCWGEPDLSAVFAEALAESGQSAPRLDPDEPIVVAATLGRGEVRCDYPPGTWQLEMTIQPLVDGLPVEPIELAPVPIEIPSSGQQRLRLERQGTRYCGLATRQFLEQGEPPIIGEE